MSRINQALNYPALTYDDVFHFFDQAISEINTSLRIALPTVTEMKVENTFDITKDFYTIPVTEDDAKNYIPDEKHTTGSIYYDVSGDSRLDYQLYIFKNNLWIPVDKVYGISELGKAYEVITVDRFAVWKETSLTVLKEFSLTDYLSIDWIILFIIPYVCFKFAVRNGDSGALFSDEFTQGFQQLQTSYNVPNEVTLSTVAHLPAYRDVTAKNLSNLNKKVFTRAITSDMRVTNSVKAVYGGNLFENGGWGI